MRTLSTDLQDHFEQNHLTIAYCLKVTRRDLTVLGFSSTDFSFTFDGTVYQPTDGAGMTALRSSADSGVDNLDLRGVLSDSRISEEDLRSGRYDGAAVELFVVNYMDLTQGAVVLLKGFFGEVSLTDGEFEVEVRSLSSILKQTVGDVTTSTCRVKRLGDAQCKFDLDGNTEDGHAAKVTKTVTNVASLLTITFGSETAPTGYFDNGIVRWTSGDNDGLEFVIKQHTLVSGEAVIKLRTPLPLDAQVGDTAVLETGCDRRLTTCRDKFDNVVNFHGEPHLPGNDTIVKLGRIPN